MWAKEVLTAIVVLVCACLTEAKIPLPNFDQLKSLFPGFRHHGGHYNDDQILNMIGGRKNLQITETTGLRLSYALNKIGNGHEINSYPVELTNLTTYWSTMGADESIYLTHALAFGPYFAIKYGNPEMVRPGIWNRDKIMDDFMGRQGIMRIVTYDKRKKAQAFVGLWDCNKFYKSRDYREVLHLLSVEFWETKDALGCSYTKKRKFRMRGKTGKNRAGRKLPKWLR